MAVVKILNGNRAMFSCSICQREFEADHQAADGVFAEVLKRIYNDMPCPECEGKIRFERVEENRQVREAELKQSIPVRMRKAGFGENFCNINAPIIRSTAEWIYRNRFNHLLISGETGSGKTSGVAFVIAYMMQKQTPYIMYRTWQKLHAELLAAKKSDSDSEMRFFNRIDNLDYLIIDELILRKGTAKFTPTGQDLLFNLVDGAYSGNRETKIWILGNFFNGSIDLVLEDPMPTRRRLQESFKRAVFRPDGSINDDITIFEKGEIK